MVSKTNYFTNKVEEKITLLANNIRKYVQVINTTADKCTDKVCEVKNLYADILHYSAHETLLMLDTHCILDNSTSKQNCITWHLITGSLST